MGGAERPLEGVMPSPGRSAVALVALVASACASSLPAPPPPDDSARASQVQRLLSERRRVEGAVNYRFVSGDLLAVRVRDMEELSGQFRVSEKGNITLALVGQLAVAGLTAEQAAGRLESQLGAYAKAPEVTLSVAEFRGARVSVVGAVASPGVFALHGFDQTIADVLTRAGGLSADAGTKIYFSPALEDPDGPQAMAIDLTRLYQGQSVPALELPVRGGDTILVPAAGEVYVDGWVNTPGGFALKRALTVTQAVANAGGLHFAGSSRALTLQRATRDGEIKTYRVDYQRILDGAEPDLYLDNGDRIQVGASPVRVVPWGIFAFFKGIVSYGVGGSAPLPGGKVR